MVPHCSFALHFSDKISEVEHLFTCLLANSKQYFTFLSTINACPHIVLTFRPWFPMFLVFFLPYKQLTFFTHNSGSWKSKIKVPTWSNVRALLLGGSQLGAFMLRPHVGRTPCSLFLTSDSCLLLESLLLHPLLPSFPSFESLLHSLFFILILSILLQVFELYPLFILSHIDITCISCFWCFVLIVSMLVSIFFSFSPSIPVWDK